MSVNRANFSQSEEMIIRRYCQNFEKYYKKGSPLKLPESESTETIVKKICQLARDTNLEDLRKLMRTCDDRLLQYLAVTLLAREGDEAKVNLLINCFYASAGAAAKGYAWGGHLELLNKVCSAPVDRIEGFALGRHIEQINQMLKEEDEFLIGYAALAYKHGGHIENLEETLELITLTTCKSLRECIASELKKKITTVDVDSLLMKAQKLTMLMQEHKVNYSKSLAILNDVEKTGLLTENVSSPEKETITTSFNLFKSAASKKLSFYQMKAINECPGITENIMLDWQPSNKENFSLCHLQALKYFLSKQFTPAQAIKEIKQLNQYQVCALIELHSRGLSGDQLREWQKNGNFTAITLEKLLMATTQQNIEPIAALNKIDAAKPMSIPVYRK